MQKWVFNFWPALNTGEWMHFSQYVIYNIKCPKCPHFCGAKLWSGLERAIITGARNSYHMYQTSVFHPLVLHIGYETRFGLKTFRWSRNINDSLCLWKHVYSDFFPDITRHYTKFLRKYLNNLMKHISAAKYNLK